MRRETSMDNEAVDRKDRLIEEIRVFLERIENLKGELIETFGIEHINAKILDNCEADERAASRSVGETNIIVLQLRRDVLEANLRELQEEKQRISLKQRR